MLRSPIKKVFLCTIGVNGAYGCIVRISHQNYTSGQGDYTSRLIELRVSTHAVCGSRATRRPCYYGCDPCNQYSQISLLLRMNKRRPVVVISTTLYTLDA
jgi:hypothetical protein